MRRAASLVATGPNRLNDDYTGRLSRIWPRLDERPRHLLDAILGE